MSSEISSSPPTAATTTTTEILPIQTTAMDTTLNQTPTIQNQVAVVTEPTSSPPPAEPRSINFCLPIPFKTKPVLKKGPLNANNTSINGSSSTHDVNRALLNIIYQDLKYVKDVSGKLQKYEDAEIKYKQIEASKNYKELRQLKKTVSKLKLMVSSKYKVSAVDNDLRGIRQSNGVTDRDPDIADELFDKMPQLYNNSVFEGSFEFDHLKSLYDGLRMELKLCLLCFSVFKENAVIRKRMMVYWWIGEGLVPKVSHDENEKTMEDLGNELFYELIKKGFIEPVYKKRSLSRNCGLRHTVSSCKMHPFVRSVVITLAERAKFFDFDSRGNATEDFRNSYRACLAGAGLTKDDEFEKLHMLFNLNEAFLDFRREWFLRMRNVNVLYLGRWQASSTHHIEVEETNFIDALENMSHLRFFSLQGVSRIAELPKSISFLTSLMILDLRACHNLEVIPKEIGVLKSLTHLDMAECYLLERMPKEISSLSELQVLKGFVVGDLPDKGLCTLNDLTKLVKLRKLSIFTGLKKFPEEKDLIALKKLQVLCKLTIAWGGGATHGKPSAISPALKPDGGDKEKVTGGAKLANAPSVDHRPSRSLTRSVAFKDVTLFPKLEKLDLQCFPLTSTPSWLMPGNLKGLKKLYIRGGKFADIGQFQEFDARGGENLPERWTAEVLHLKYLSELQMDWIQLQELFPKLVYMEKVKCPRLSLFPCDTLGVWMNRRKLKELQEINGS